MRKVHIENEEWEYLVGTSFLVIYPPNSNEKYIIHLANFCNISMHDWENILRAGKNKKSRMIDILPSDIKTFIINKLLRK